MSNFGCFDADSGELISINDRSKKDTSKLEGIVFEGHFQFNVHKMINGQIIETVTIETVVISPKQIDTHVTRLLTQSSTFYAEWRVARHIERGEVIPVEIVNMRENIRIAGRALKAMSPTPEDFWDAKYWPKGIE